MKRIRLLIIGAGLALVGYAVAGVPLGGTGIAQTGPPEGHKVTICHAVQGGGETGNGFNIVDVDKDSIANVEGTVNGHGLHVSDIIPSFPAGNDPGPPAKQWGSFPGLGDASWIANNCAAPSTSSTTNETTTDETTTEQTTTEQTTTEQTTTGHTTTAATTVESTTASTSTAEGTTTTATETTTSANTPTTTTAGGVEGTTTTHGSPPSAAAGGSQAAPATQTLPYTGAADWAPALTGAVLLAAGLVLRRLGRAD